MLLSTTLCQLQIKPCFRLWPGSSLRSEAAAEAASYNFRPWEWPKMPKDCGVRGLPLTLLKPTPFSKLNSEPGTRSTLR